MPASIRTLPAKPVALPLAIFRRFKEGDPEAFAEVMRKYEPLVRGVAARYWRSVFDREEAMQEIWLHAWRNREALDLRRADAFLGWLAVLARRRCIDLLRQPADPAVRDGEEEEAAAIEWLQAGAPQEQAVAHDELGRAIDAFRMRLKPGWREFFQLHFVEGRPYAEVGARLHIGKLRCKYMRKVLAARAAKDPGIVVALGRSRTKGGGDASSA